MTSIITTFAQVVPEGRSELKLVPRAELGGPLHRFRTWRALSLVWRSRRHDLLVLFEPDSLTLPALLFSSLTRRRHVIIVHAIFGIRRDTRRRRLKNRILTVLLNRSVVAIHVLRSSDCAYFARQFRFPRDRITFIPVSNFDGRYGPLPQGQSYVLASGRSLCDWPTVVAAAAKAEWPLVIACGNDDAAEVKRLVGDLPIDVRVELPYDVHRALADGAAIIVVALVPADRSLGHLRITDAAAARAALVITESTDLADYVEPGKTCMVVPPGDSTALQAAIDDLWRDPEKRVRFAENAAARIRSWTVTDYRQALRDLIDATAEMASARGSGGKPYRGRRG